jgi:phage-related minor tail protein
LAGNIKGITVEIGGNTGPLDKALQGVNKTSRDLQTELRQVEKLLKLDPTNTELLAQKQKILADSVDNTSNKLTQLKEAEKQVQQQFKDGKVSEEQYRALQREIIKAEQEMKGLEAQGKKTNAVLSEDKAINNLKNIGMALGATAVAAGAALTGMAVAAMNNADELQRQADVTGLSAERLQELQYAGNNLGVELDTITGAQAKLTKSMDAAKDGTGAQADAFKALGISVTDSNGQLRSAQDVMAEAFTALNSVGNETERDALAMQIFGKSAMEMNPLIKAGGDELNRLSKEARDNGAVMSDEAVAGLDAFGDTIDNLKTSILGSFGEALAESLPDIQEFLNKLIELPEWIDKNKTLLMIIGIVLGTFTAAIIAYNIAAGWAAITTGIMTTATAAFGAVLAFVTSPITIVILAIGALIAIGVLLYKNWDTITAACGKAWDWILDKISSVIEGIVSFFTNTIPGFVDTVLEWFERLPGAMLDIGKNIVSGIWDGIQGMASWLWNKVTGFVGGIVDEIKSMLKINSPSQVFADEIGAYMAQGIGIGFESEMGGVSTNMAKAIPVKKQDYFTEASSFESRNAGVQGNSSTSTEFTINTPVYLDGKVITNKVSKLQYLNGRITARESGVAVG